MESFYKKNCQKMLSSVRTLTFLGADLASHIQAHVTSQTSEKVGSKNGEIPEDISCQSSSQAKGARICAPEGGVKVSAGTF